MIDDLLEEIRLPTLNVVSERVLHSDRYMERVASDIPGFLKTYFDFPDDEFPEVKINSPLMGRSIGHVPHVTNALQRMITGGQLIFRWFTDGAKSKTGTFFYPIIDLAIDPDSAHILCCANFDDSKRRVQMLERELETNHRLIADFPWLKKPERSSGLTWSRREFTVSGRSTNRPDPSVYAASTTADDVRQRRGKLIMDDIEGKDSRVRASVRKELYDFVKLEAIRCWEDRAESLRPLRCLMGTPFDIDSIYISLPNEDPDYQVITVPAYTVPWDKFKQYCFMKLADGSQSNWQTPWEERAKLLPNKLFTWPRKRMKIAKQDPQLGHGMNKSQFFLAYLLDPTVGNPMRLSLDQIRAIVSQETEVGTDQWFEAVSLDPAAGVGEDYAGVSVIRIRWPREQKFPDLQILEAHAFEQGLFEQVNFVADLCHRYGQPGKPLPLIFERNSQQGGTYSNAFGHMRPEIALIPVYTSQADKFDTEMGLTVIRTLVKEKHVHVPQSSLDSEGMTTLMREVRDLGTAAHDHICCSVWFVVKWVYNQVRSSNMPQLVPTTAAGFGRGNGPAPTWRSWQGRA